MGFLETPRNEFEITVRVRWFLDKAQAAELLRAMAHAPPEVYFTAEEFNRVVDWVAGDGSASTVRKPEVLGLDFTKRLSRALRPFANEAAEERTRKLLRDMFAKTVEAIARMGAS